MNYHEPGIWPPDGGPQLPDKDKKQGDTNEEKLKSPSKRLSFPFGEKPRREKGPEPPTTVLEEFLSQAIHKTPQEHRNVHENNEETATSDDEAEKTETDNPVTTVVPAYEAVSLVESHQSVTPIQERETTIPETARFVSIPLDLNKELEIPLHETVEANEVHLKRPEEDMNENETPNQAGEPVAPSHVEQRQTVPLESVPSIPPQPETEASSDNNQPPEPPIDHNQRPTFPEPEPSPPTTRAEYIPPAIHNPTNEWQRPELTTNSAAINPNLATAPATNTATVEKIVNDATRRNESHGLLVGLIAGSWLGRRRNRRIQKKFEQKTKQQNERIDKLQQQQAQTETGLSRTQDGIQDNQNEINKKPTIDEIIRQHTLLTQASAETTQNNDGLAEESNIATYPTTPASEQLPNNPSDTDTPPNSLDAPKPELPAKKPQSTIEQTSVAYPANTLHFKPETETTVPSPNATAAIEQDPSVVRQIDSVWAGSEQTESDPNVRPSSLAETSIPAPLITGETNQPNHSQLEFERKLADIFPGYQGGSRPAPEAQAGQLPEVPDNHHVESSVWHNIEVDNQTGRAVENPVFHYGDEFQRERGHETKDNDNQEEDVIATASGQLAVGGVTDLGLSSASPASTPSSASSQKRPTTLANRLESTLRDRRNYQSVIPDTWLWGILVVVIITLVLVIYL